MLWILSWAKENEKKNEEEFFRYSWFVTELISSLINCVLFLFTFTVIRQWLIISSSTWGPCDCLASSPPSILLNISCCCSVSNSSKSRSESGNRCCWKKKKHMAHHNLFQDTHWTFNPRICWQMNRRGGGKARWQNENNPAASFSKTFRVFKPCEPLLWGFNPILVAWSE